jgi:CBS-domain-containing membrane protein
MSTLLEQTLAVGQGTARTRVADSMITCPKTHGPGSSVDEIRALFDDDHVHIALIVAADRRLITTIERSDLAAATARSGPVAGLGTLAGRTVGPSSPLDAATATLVREGRRRLAVVDHSGRLLGLLCLKRDGKGYCSDDGIRARANEFRRSQRHRSQHDKSQVERRR